MSTTSIALIGAGSRGLQIYAAYIEQHPEQAKIVAVTEPRQWFRDETARRHGIPSDRVFSDWRELLSRPKLADAVIIATPDDLHVAPAAAAAECGYDILLEKPMATTESGCREIIAAVRRHGVILAVAHVLRYTAYFRAFRELIRSGVLGDVVTLRHFEPVGYWHQAHSFVRGNWRNSSLSSPMILAKSCHDMDILMFLLGRQCERVSSFGSLFHFRKENHPAGAAERCLDCVLADTECPYSATSFYFGKLRGGDYGWPLNVVTNEFTEAALTRALREGPYGRCVYACDNDVVDHQVINFEFSGGVTASFTMNAFTHEGMRRMEVFGTRGQAVGNGQEIELVEFLGEKQRMIDLRVPEHLQTGGHLGGDAGMMDDFLQAVQKRDASLICSSAEESLTSHLMAFAAERSRLERAVVPIVP